MDKTNKNQFNQANEANILKKINAYNLTQEEKQQVWKEVQQRNDNIKQETQDYRENWKSRFNTELEYLRANQKPENPAMHYRPYGATPKNTDMELRVQASQNVQKNHQVRKKQMYQNCDQNINKVLDQAKHQGRGPQQERTRPQNQTQYQSPTQQFNLDR